MAGSLKNADAVRAIRDRLRADLELLDKLGEQHAAIELNSAIEILNDRLGEPATPEEIARLAGRFFDN